VETRPDHIRPRARRVTLILVHERRQTKISESWPLARPAALPTGRASDDDGVDRPFVLRKDTPKLLRAFFVRNAYGEPLRAQCLNHLDRREVALRVATARDEEKDDRAASEKPH